MSENLRTQIAFSMVRNINSGLAEQMLARIGSEEAFFEMPVGSLSALGLASGLFKDPHYRPRLIEQATNELRFVTANNIAALYYTSPDYPERLTNCSDGPVMLYRLGTADLNSKHIISIVGTRHATPYGLEMTARIVRELSEQLDDLVIVSGLAYGIDVAAHKAALECGVPTVAVTAHPLNTIYPADHRSVAVKIVNEGGALVTEYSTSHEVHKANFLARNRIIAGMADVTIIVESDEKGGSLVTAGLASEYNRDVYAVPGRLTDRYSRGTLRLLSADRAHIYTSAEALIEDMRWQPKNSPAEPELPLEMSPDEQAVYDFLTAHPASRVSEIATALSMTSIRLKDILFTMEMNDQVMSMAGGKYSVL